MMHLLTVGKTLEFIFAGLLDTIKQRRVFKARERAALHNLRLALIQKKITEAQR